MGQRRSHVRGAAAAGSGTARAMLLASGLVFLAAALLYNEWSLGALLGGEKLGALTREKVRAAEIGLALAGAALLAASGLVRRWPRLAALAARPRIATGLLAALAVVVPLALFELGLRPFVEPKTTIFVEDAKLGWKLRPDAVGEWGGVRVSVNGKGLRGPELDYARIPGTTRILYLGDSVTFGYGLESHDQSFPYRVGHALRRRLGREIETLNAGVGGYSPWQEYVYFASEGVRYAPDLVVVAFVLNDVTEKLSLIRYGGSHRGWQLARTARGALDRWLSGSAVVLLLREGVARLRFGSDVPAGASEVEAAAVRWMAADPERPRLERAWRITLANLARIFDLAAEHEMRAALVIVPHRFQLAAPRLHGKPQRLVAGWASERGIPTLDLLPLLAARARPQEDAPSPDFLDESHLSVQGHAAAAEWLAAFLVERGLLPAKPGSDE